MNACPLRVLRFLLPIIALLAGIPSAAQVPGSNGIVAGVHGGDRVFGEVGYILMMETEKYHLSSQAYTLSALVSPATRTIVGADFSYLFTLFILSGGLGFTYYTDFESSSFRIRPEIGIGVPNLRLNAGLNIPITGSSFEGISKGEFSIRVVIPFK